MAGSQAMFKGWRGEQPFAARADHAGGDGAPAAAGLFERLEAILAAYPAAHGYRPDRRFIAEVAGLSADERAFVGRDFLLWQMARFDERWERAGFAPEFHGWFVDAFHNILDQMASAQFVGEVGRDVWQKNLALTRLVRVPACAQLVAMASGVPRGVAVKSGLAGLYHVAVRCGGFAPFAEIHTHDPMVAAYFNAAGWERTCHMLALLMRDNPRCRGVFATSWFFDPEVARVSPKLGFLRGLPEAAGARFLRMGADADSIGLATGFPPRRKAYEAGIYLPCRYAIVWGRRDLLAHYG